MEGERREGRKEERIGGEGREKEGKEEGLILVHNI